MSAFRLIDAEKKANYVGNAVKRTQGNNIKRSQTGPAGTEAGVLE